MSGPNSVMVRASASKVDGFGFDHRPCQTKGINSGRN